MGTEPTTFTDRLRTLVDAQFAGNVLAASERWGIPQQTLHRLHFGKTKTPTIGVLVRIAEGAGASLDWLTRGIGATPMLSQQLSRAAELQTWSRSRLVAHVIEMEFSDV